MKNIILATKQNMRVYITAHFDGTFEIVDRNGESLGRSNNLKDLTNTLAEQQFKMEIL